MEHLLNETITIVGASAAGLFSAYLLAKAGLKVQLLEKSNTIGPPPRTLIVTRKIFDVLGPEFDLSDIIVNQIRKVGFFSPHCRESLAFKNPDLIIEREELLKLLARKAAGAGAEIYTNAERKDFSPAETEVLVDASGVKQSATTVALLQAEVEIPNGVDKEMVQVFFDTRKTKYFFWIIPKSKNEAAVGLIADNKVQAKNALDEFLATKNFKAKSYQQGRAPLFRPLTKVKRGNTFLVGDAALQVKNSTVGGVVAGLRGARALAESLIKGTGYQKEMRGLNWELTLHWLARRTLNKLTNKDYDKLLELLTPEVKKLLATYTRDEAARGALKLFLAQPRLLTFLLKIF